MNVRIPPNDVDAEQSVLTCMLFDTTVIPMIAATLNVKDFYQPDNAEIFNALIYLSENNFPIDLITLKTELIRRNTFNTIGGATRLTELATSFSTSVNVKYHTAEIKRHAESRRILASLTSLIQKTEDITVDDLRAVTQAAEKNQYIQAYADKSIQNLDDFKKNLRVKKPRIHTGFSIMDAITGGFRIPSVVIIGAYPSVGKTAFALNIAAKQEKPVVFFSLEMSNEMIYERLASSRLKIDYNLFTEQGLSDRQYAEVETFADTIKKDRFYVFDDTYHLEQQAGIIANIKPCLVVVDYIQKVKTHRKIENRRTEIDYISGMYKQIAKNNNCVVLLLSQLSRPDKQSKNIKPTMASLKESGALEADGDYIGMLHRPYVLQKDDPTNIKPEEGYILIDKNKFGTTGQINLHFEGRYQRFYETDCSKQMPKRSYQQESLYDESNPVDDELPFPI